MIYVNEEKKANKMFGMFGVVGSLMALYISIFYFNGFHRGVLSTVSLLALVFHLYLLVTVISDVEVKE